MDKSTVLYFRKKRGLRKAAEKGLGVLSKIDRAWHNSPSESEKKRMIRQVRKMAMYYTSLYTGINTLYHMPMPTERALTNARYVVKSNRNLIKSLGLILTSQGDRNIQTFLSLALKSAEKLVDYLQ